MSKGLVRCPCGQPEAAICAHCARSVCSEHHAYTPTGESGRMDPACFPRCDAPWWATLAPPPLDSPEEYVARVASDDDERRTLLHAVGLLRHDADAGVVAGELGLSEHRVRALARRIRQRRS